MSENNNNDPFIEKKKESKKKLNEFLNADNPHEEAHDVLYEFQKKRNEESRIREEKNRIQEELLKLVKKDELDFLGYLSNVSTEAFEQFIGLGNTKFFSKQEGYTIGVQYPQVCFKNVLYQDTSKRFNLDKEKIIFELYMPRIDKTVKLIPTYTITTSASVFYNPNSPFSTKFNVNCYKLIDITHSKGNLVDDDPSISGGKRRKTKHNRKHKHRRPTKRSRKHKYNRSRK
jgi:hypothetical protein